MNPHSENNTCDYQWIHVYIMDKMEPGTTLIIFESVLYIGLYWFNLMRKLMVQSWSNLLLKLGIILVQFIVKPWCNLGPIYCENLVQSWSNLLWKLGIILVQPWCNLDAIYCENVSGNLMQSFVKSWCNLLWKLGPIYCENLVQSWSILCGKCEDFVQSIVKTS